MIERWRVDTVPEAPPPKTLRAEEFVEFYAPYFDKLSQSDREFIASKIASWNTRAPHGGTE